MIWDATNWIQQSSVLSVLYKRGDTPLQQIGDQILITSGSVTYVIDKLEKRGLIERVACPSDRRVTYASLTETGKHLMDVVYPEHIEIFKDIYGPLSESETETLIELLKRVGYNAAGKWSLLCFLCTFILKSK